MENFGGGIERNVATWDTNATEEGVFDEVAVAKQDRGDKRNGAGTVKNVADQGLAVGLFMKAEADVESLHPLLVM